MTKSTFFIRLHYDKIYIGQTENLEIKFDKHNQGLVKSTKANCPWKIVSHEEFRFRSDTMQREKQFKSHQGRNWIREVVLKRCQSAEL